MPDSHGLVDSRTRRSARAVGIWLQKPVLAAVVLAWLAAMGGNDGAWAQNLASTLDDVLANQSSVLERFSVPREPGKVELTVPDLRKRIAMEEARRIRFELRSLTLEGAETLSLTDLAPAWHDQIGKMISLADLYGIADRVDAAYRRAGYFSLTIVPVQDYRSGRIVLRLYESYIRDVVIKSDVPGMRERLAPYIDRLTAMRPIRIKEVERVLLLMSDLGGLTIEGIVKKPETASGGGELVLEIQFKRATGSVNLDNLGSSTTGPLELSGTVTVNDAFHWFESTTLLGMTVPNSPEELVFLQGSQDAPIGYDGLHAGYSLGYIASQPGGSLRPNDINVSAAVGSLYVSYPLLRTIEQSLFGRLDFNFKDNHVDIAAIPAVEDRNRWLAASLRYERDFEKGSAALTGTFGQGINGLGAVGSFGDLVSRAGVPEDYNYVRLDVDLSRDLTADTKARLRVAGQYAPVALPSAVQLNLGGDPYGRAFDGGMASGDSGAATVLEVSRRLDLPWTVLSKTSAFVFADYGAVWNHDVDVAYLRESLGSAGIGVRSSLAGWVNGQLLVAVPYLDEDDLSDTGTRIFFNLGAPF